MVTPANLRELYGDVVETTTIVRSLLAPVASQLSGDPSGLHCRCVLNYCVGFLIPREPEDVHADLAPFGAIEAVAVCDIFNNAVIVFRDEASVPIALRRQAEVSKGLLSAVPPLEKALPLRYSPLDQIKVALNPPRPPRAVLRAPRRLRPLHWFRNYPGEPCLNPHIGTPGTVEFRPFKESRVYGPAVAADGSLWMKGDLIYYHAHVKGCYLVDPVWIRVVRIDRPWAYADGPPTFVPYLSYC